MSLPSAAAAATAASVAAIAANYIPLPALPVLPAGATRAMTALSVLPAVRGSGLRPGRTLNTTRPANLEALLGQLTGQVNAAACTHCAGGAGVWTVCVSAAGFFLGSCANCHYGSEGARCSLRGAGAPAAGSSSSRVATGRRIVDQVAPGTPSSSSRPRRSISALTGQIRRPRRSAAERAARFARLHRELASLYEEEAAVLREEEEETDYSVLESDEESS